MSRKLEVPQGNHDKIRSRRYSQGVVNTHFELNPSERAWALGECEDFTKPRSRSKSPFRSKRESPEKRTKSTQLCSDKVDSPTSHRRVKSESREDNNGVVLKKIPIKEGLEHKVKPKKIKKLKLDKDDIKIDLIQSPRIDLEEVKMLAADDLKISLEKTPIETETMTEEERKIASENRMRMNIAEELLSTEKSYVESLASIQNHFINAVQASKKPVISTEQVKHIFLNWSSILNCHINMLKVLRLRISKWDPNIKVGDVFVDSKMNSFFQLYKYYINNYDKAAQYLLTLRSKNTISKFITEVEEKIGGGLKLESFLIKPVQRITRYNLLIDNLLKHTNPEHLDYEDLGKASDQFQSVVMLINESKRRTEQLDEVKKLCFQIQGFPTESLLSTPGLHLLKWGDLWEGHVNQGPKLFVILLNNCLVLSTLTDKKDKDVDKDRFKYKLKELLFWENTRFYLNKVKEIPSLVLISTNDEILGVEKKIKLRHESDEELQNWNLKMLDAYNQSMEENVVVTENQEEELKQYRLKRRRILSEYIQNEVQYVSHLQSLLPILILEPPAHEDDIFIEVSSQMKSPRSPFVPNILNWNSKGKTPRPKNMVDSGEDATGSVTARVTPGSSMVEVTPQGPLTARIQKNKLREKCATLPDEDVVEPSFVVRPTSFSVSTVRTKTSSSNSSTPPTISLNSSQPDNKDPPLGDKLKDTPTQKSNVPRLRFNSSLTTSPGSPTKTGKKTDSTGITLTTVTTGSAGTTGTATPGASTPSIGTPPLSSNRGRSPLSVPRLQLKSLKQSGGGVEVEQEDQKEQKGESDLKNSSRASLYHKQALSPRGDLISPRLQNEKESPESGMTQDLKPFFDALKPIIEAHMEMKPMLFEKMTQFSVNPNLGTLFLNFPELFAYYDVYCEMWEVKKSSLAEALKKNKTEFGNLARQFEEEHTLTLFQFLDQVSSTLPHIYSLLTDLAQFTMDHEPDHSFLQTLTLDLQQTNDKIIARKKHEKTSVSNVASMEAKRPSGNSRGALMKDMARGLLSKVT